MVVYIFDFDISYLKKKLEDNIKSCGLLLNVRENLV